MRLLAASLAFGLAAPVIARAAPADEIFLSERALDGVQFARVRLPARPMAAGAQAQSKVIYLNKNGITLQPGDDDARTNRSSIISGARSVPSWNTSAANWAATVQCMKDMFAPFDVTVTDVDPGMVPHMEAVFGGSPGNIGMGQGVGGVSPFTTDCAVIENSIVFTFTNAVGSDARTVCEIMAQEVAHSYGLDHEMLASDPMTYLNYNGDRSFKDQTVPCGEYQNRACGIGGSVCRPNQNSVQLLTERLGRADLVAPTLSITSPADGETVAPGFLVAATATDNVAVTGGRLFIDDVDVGPVTGPGPFTFPTDPDLADGVHVLRVEVTDGKHPVTSTITVTVARTGPGGDGDGNGDGDGDGDGGGDDDGAITAGCAAGGPAGPGAALALLLVRRRRR